MKQIAVCPCDIPEELREGLAQLCENEGFCLDAAGLPLYARRAEHYRVQHLPDALRVEYDRPVQFFRALSLLKTPQTAPDCPERPPVFKHDGVMLDCSRNGVLRPESIRMILRKMALMGLDTLMLYTEDTYEIKNRPYFGYLRGRYTTQELQELDAYAAALGIEMVPCIQTLAHLERALHWPQIDPDTRDTEDILMVDEPKTYAWIEDMITALRAAFRSSRIHIGMDEAWMLGLGNYRLRHGIEPAHKLMARHLEKVRDIARRHGFSPMIWSDMYLCAASPTGEYYNAVDPIPEEVVRSVCEGVSLVYWDYFHEDGQDYDRMLRLHRQFGGETMFAGGLWTWIGPAPALDKMRRASLPALRACEKNGVDTVVGTAWGDNGAECSLLAALYGMQLYAEYNYTGEPDTDWLDARFLACTGEPAAPFALMSQFNTPPGVVSRDENPVNVSKFLLYEDPLIPLYARDTQGMCFSGFYADLAERFAAFRGQTPAIEKLYRFYEAFARLMAAKCRWRENLPALCAETAGQGIAMAQDCRAEIARCRLAWEALWEQVNKPFGFEIIDLRLSGLDGRYETTLRKLERLRGGDTAVLALVREEKLRVLSDEEGRFYGIGAWSDCVSACKV